MDTSLAYSIVPHHDPATNQTRTSRIELRRLATPRPRSDKNNNPLPPFTHGVWADGKWQEFITTNNAQTYLTSFQVINHNIVEQQKLLAT